MKLFISHTIIYYLCQGSYVFASIGFVCLLAPLLKKYLADVDEFSGQLGNDKGKNWLDCGGDPDHHLDMEYF